MSIRDLNEEEEKREETCDKKIRFNFNSNIITSSYWFIFNHAKWNIKRLQCAFEIASI